MTVSDPLTIHSDRPFRCTSGCMPYLGWFYKGLKDPVTGNLFQHWIMINGPEEDISSNWIVVTRNTPNGGRVYTIDDKDYVNGVFGSDQVVFKAKNSSNADSISYWYIVTDVNDNILKWIPANNNRENAIIARYQK